MSNDYKTWWEIPSIVHFCEVFSPCCKDLCPVDINEFELAVENNSILLTDMALRFMKIYGFYNPNTNDWWTKMKSIFHEKCAEYNFEYPLDSVLNFDDLTPKRKVEALYIMCHIVLDVEIIQYNISNKHELWRKFNVKPLGYDLNNSVYWYFGTTRLYREDFENAFESSENSSLSHVSLQSCHTRPYPSGILGSGKWNTVCDDNNSWYLFADNIQYSKNTVIRSLHNSVCNIIENLPSIKKNKFRYKYFKCLQNKSVLTRSTSVSVTDVNRSFTDFVGRRHLPRKCQDKKTKQNNLFSRVDTHKNNTSLGVQTRNMLHSKNIYNDYVERNSVKIYCNETTKLPLKNINAFELHSANINANGSHLLKPYQDTFKRELRVNLERCDQENNVNFENF